VHRVLPSKVEMSILEKINEQINETFCVGISSPAQECANKFENDICSNDEINFRIISFLSCVCCILLVLLFRISWNSWSTIETSKKRSPQSQRISISKPQSNATSGRVEPLILCGRQNNITYLDHAGATLYNDELVSKLAGLLRENIYGNPHTSGPASNLTEALISDTRRKLLEHFGVNDSTHVVVFTSGTTAGLKLIGESFEWTGLSKFCYHQNAHTSVVGIREYAIRKGASFECIQNLEEFASTLLERDSTGLLAFTAESNFGGTKADLNIVSKIKTSSVGSKWKVILDAAKFAATNPLNLSEVKADFTVVSFYKMFGFPAGLGAIIMTKDAALDLTPQYFGGGTISVCASEINFKRYHQNISKRFEAGTLDFLGIVSASAGLDMLNRVGMKTIQDHTFVLAQELYSRLDRLRHCNGNPVCLFYGNHHLRDKRKQGSIVTFNVLDDSGNMISHTEVGRLAGLNNIQIRTGMFCNPGASQRCFGLSTEDIKNYSGQSEGCWEEIGLLNNGTPTGAVRVSFGYSSSSDDVDIFMQFISTFFVSATKECCDAVGDKPITLGETESPIVEAMYLYPIKSCGGIRTSQWPLTSSGFLYDRNWVLVDSEGKSLDQKKLPQMCRIIPEIDLKTHTMTVMAAVENAPAPLRIDLKANKKTLSDGSFRICDRLQNGKSMCRDISSWFSQVLGVSCTLVQNVPNPNRSFANRGQLLMISRSSVKWLTEKLKHQQCHVDDTSFRPNIVISGCTPHAEDSWSNISIGEARFLISGPCNRCPMVNINQKTGKQDRNILLELAKYRRTRSHINFGQFLSVEQRRNFTLSVNDPIFIVQ